MSDSRILIQGRLSYTSAANVKVFSVTASFPFLSTQGSISENVLQIFDNWRNVSNVTKKDDQISLKTHMKTQDQQHTNFKRLRK